MRFTRIFSPLVFVASLSVALPGCGGSSGEVEVQEHRSDLIQQQQRAIKARKARRMQKAREEIQRQQGLETEEESDQ